MRVICKLLLIGSILFLNACSTTVAPRGWKKRDIVSKPVLEIKNKQHHKVVKSKKVVKVNKKRVSKKHYVASASYKKFKKSTNLRKSFKVFKNTKLLQKSTARNTKLIVDISDQRVKLYINNSVALDAPCTTGAKNKFEPNTKTYRDKHTPKGKFRITEKLSNKRSTIFGGYYRGSKKVYHGDKRKFKGSKKGLHYKGASLKNWMRLTSSGIGLHGSKYVKRNPGTNGCIRLPFSVSRTLFKHVNKGTQVSIVN